MEQTIIQLRKGYRAIPTNADEVQVRMGTWAGPILFLSDDERAGVLQKLLERIQAGASEEALRADFGSHTALIDQTISLLRVNGVLEGNATGAIPTSFNGAWSRPESLAGKKIAVIGAGRIGSRIADSLIRHGCESITLVDADVLATGDRLAIMGGHLAAEGEPRADAVAAHCNLLAGGNFVTSRKLDQTSLVDAVANSDLVIVAEDELHPSVCESVNTEAIRARRPWILVSFDGPEVCIGPAFIPFESGCYTCYSRRLVANTRSKEALEAYLTYLDTPTGRVAQQAPMQLAMSDLASSLAVGDAASIMAAHEGYLVGAQYVANSSEMTIRREPFLRLPRCESCGKVARGGTLKQLYGPLSHLLDEIQAGRGRKS